MPTTTIGTVLLTFSPKCGNSFVRNPNGSVRNTAIHFSEVNYYPEKLGDTVSKIMIWERSRGNSNSIVSVSPVTSVHLIEDGKVKQHILNLKRQYRANRSSYGDREQMEKIVDDSVTVRNWIKGTVECPQTNPAWPNCKKEIGYVEYRITICERMANGRSFGWVAGWNRFAHCFSDLIHFTIAHNTPGDVVQQYRQMDSRSRGYARESWAIESQNVFGDTDDLATMVGNFDKYTLQRSAPEDLDVSEHLSVQLRPYQKRSLQFCLDVENEKDTMWVRIRESPPLFYSPYFLQFSLRGMNPPGGFLCDEMGLGKTVVSLGLIMKNPRITFDINERGTNERVHFGHTLVVCPVSLVGQWIREAKKHIIDLNHQDIYLHHGQSRMDCSASIASKKIVVTTYGIVAKEANFRLGYNHRKGALENIIWHRVIFDESHVLKNCGTLQYKAAKALRGKHKWCVTGTPLTYNNQIVSQMGLITNTFNKVRLGRKHGLTDSLLAILSHYMIRHRKTMRIDGRPIVELPECTIQNVSVTLSEEERAQYANVLQVSSSRIPFLVGLSAFREIQNVRRLLANAAVDTNRNSVSTLPVCSETVRELAEQRIDEDHCAVCLDIYDTPTITECSHVFCLQCIQHVVITSAKCPLCRSPCGNASLRLVHPLPQLPVENDGFRGFQTKVHKVKEIIDAHPEEKCLIFFNFQQSLEHFRMFLKGHRVEYSELNSTMSQRAREKALNDFENNPVKKVFLLSVRSSAVGINLTSASQVILFEPFMNTVMEKQSIGRAWRLGQTRPVTVHRMYYTTTLEQRIIEMLELHNSPNAGAWNVMNIRQLLG